MTDDNTKKIINLANNFRPVRRKTYYQAREEVQNLQTELDQLKNQPTQPQTAQPKQPKKTIRKGLSKIFRTARRSS
jgi:hypothetical protein